MQPNPFLGVAIHGIGAFSAASCYTPQKQTRLWAWEIYWITQASFAWLILPVVVALLTIPNYIDVLRSCSTDVMLRSFLYGILYGFGGLTFGLGIRYIGFSLNYTIAIGISAGVGTIVPLIWHPNEGFVWKLAEKFSNVPGLIVLFGIVLSLVGIVYCGWAGALRERSGSAAPSVFSFRRGVPLAIVAGILSAVYKFALDAGGPLADAAAKANGSELLSMNAIYPFSNGGAWVTNAAWCVILITRNRTASQFVRLSERSPGKSPHKGTGQLPFYYLMALLSGVFWYFQFFFYGIGQAYIGKQYEFTGWALHMTMLILFSNVYGVLFREWKDAGKKARWTLRAGMVIIVIATLLIACGNHQGQLLATQQR